MIKQIYVCECDICGATENAKAVMWRNETEYEIPDNWVRGNNKKVCICPECSAKLNGSKTMPTPTYISNVEAVPVYGCPAVVLDNLHDALLSGSSQGISSESTDVKATTNTTETAINDIAVTDVKKSKDFIINCADTLKKFCTARDDCDNCILQGERRCILADYDICDWNKESVLDRLDTLGLREEYDAAKALIAYCNNSSCDSHACIFNNQLCGRGLPEGWNLEELEN